MPIHKSETLHCHHTHPAASMADSHATVGGHRIDLRHSGIAPTLVTTLAKLRRWSSCKDQADFGREETLAVVKVFRQPTFPTTPTKVLTPAAGAIQRKNRWRQLASSGTMEATTRGGISTLAMSVAVLRSGPPYGTIIPISL